MLKLSVLSLGILTLVLPLTATLGAPITEGNLVISRVGGVDDDMENFPDSASRVALLEINPADGSIVQTIKLPALAADIPAGSNNHLLTLGSDFRAGQLHRSVNGLFLVIGGYNAPAKDGITAGTPLVAHTWAGDVNRIVGRIDNSGNVDTVTALATTAGQSNPGLYDDGQNPTGATSTNASFRGVATIDGTEFWLCGRQGKTSGSRDREGRVQHALYGATTSNQVPNGSTFVDARGVGIFTGRRTDASNDYTPGLQLYGSFNNLSPHGLYSIGVGTPGDTGEVTTPLRNPNSTDTPILMPSVYDFFFTDQDTVYLCEDDPPSSGNAVGTGAGIQKYVWDDTLATPAYTYRYTLNSGLDLTKQTVRTLTATVDGNGHNVLYAITASNQTTGGDRANHLVTVTDTGCPTGTEQGCSAPDTVTILTTAGDLEVYRGVALAPRACVGSECTGACCEPGHSCVETTEAACTASGGIFRGIQTTCATSVCQFVCHTPFADADGDGDVDMDDFGQFQRCLTGSAGTVSADCMCFDRPEDGFPNGNGHIDQADFNAFVNCVSGANVPANPACGG